MRPVEEHQLPFLCECGEVGCGRCVPATVDAFAADLLFAPGHEPRADLELVPEVDR